MVASGKSDRRILNLNCKQQRITRAMIRL